MRKMFASLAAFALMAAPAPFAGTAALAAPSGPGVNAQLLADCHELMDEFPDLPLGVCMSFQLSQNTYGFVPHVCAYFEDTGLLELNGFESFSDCVRNAR